MVKENGKEVNENFKPLGPSEKWYDGNRISSVTPLEVGNKKGISVRVGKKIGNYEKYTHKIWIDSEFNFSSWLKWLIETIRKPYYVLFGKQLKLDEEVEAYRVKRDLLTKQLADLEIKIEIAEKRNLESKKLLELAQKTKSKYKRDFRKIYEKDFLTLIDQSIENDKGIEEKIKNKIKEQPWLLGLECFVEAKNQDVDIQTEIDLHVKTRYNKDVIIEVKSPNVKPLKRKTHDKSRFILAAELSDAISEIVYYLRRTDIYSEKVGEGTYGIQKAEGIILIGSNLTEEEVRVLREINFHLPHIKIVTYDELKRNVEREISLLEEINAEN